MEKRSVGEIHAFVTDDLILPQHGGRFAYITPNDSLSKDNLYLLAGIINSKVVQFYYKNRQAGVKDVMVKILEDIGEDFRKAIVDKSKYVHVLMEDIAIFEND